MDDKDDNPWETDDEVSPTKASKSKKTQRNHPFQQSVKRDSNLPPNFDALLEELQKAGRSMFNFGGGGQGPILPPMRGKIWPLAIGFLTIIWVASGFFRVQETDLAAVVRLGKLSRISGPGLRYRLPFPFEKEIIRNVSSNNVMSSNATSVSIRNSDGYDKTLVLTGDENIIHISYTVTWKIKDLADYLFVVRDPDKTILAATESVIREVVGQTDALSALTEERSTISAKSSQLLQKVLDQYKIGVQIVQVQLQKVEPPAQVVDAFNDMQASLTDGDGMRIKAEAYASEVIPRAQGEAEKITQEAEGYYNKVIAEAQGEAERFNSIYDAYKLNPTVASMRMYMDTMDEILRKGTKVVVPNVLAKNNMALMRLNPDGKTVTRNTERKD